MQMGEVSLKTNQTHPKIKRKKNLPNTLKQIYAVDSSTFVFQIIDYYITINYTIIIKISGKLMCLV